MRISAHSAAGRGRGPAEGSPYVSYLYSYPHKTAYRPLEPTRALGDVWRGERRDALFLYLHIPYCEMRCGFCNLFTTVGTRADALAGYVDALARQARRVRASIGQMCFARVAIGGGTPTFLPAAQLERVLDVAEDIMGAELARVPTSVETSPETATPDRLRVLRARGVERISIGVQSFVDDEVRMLGRAQSASAVARALGCIRDSGVATLNIDLMYGTPGQTVASFVTSIERALAFDPEEIYLYPLYVRPLTGLSRSSRARVARPLARDGRGDAGDAAWDEQRLAMYRAGRDALLERGYEQLSMRMFRRRVALARAHGAGALADAPVYRCQEDGMVGLGAGARSYTDGLHYSTDYAVGSREIRSIIGAYTDRDERGFETVDYGFALDEEERRRRFTILSLLWHEGLHRGRYRARFGADVLDHVPELAHLVDAGLVRAEPAKLALTERGLERSDAIGPWLRSARVRALQAGYRER